MPIGFMGSSTSTLLNWGSRCFNMDEGESIKVPMKWKIEVLKNRRIWKALCKLGTDDVIRCVNMEVKTQNREYLCK